MTSNETDTIFCGIACLIVLAATVRVDREPCPPQQAQSAVRAPPTSVTYARQTTKAATPRAGYVHANPIAPLPSR